MMDIATEGRGSFKKVKDSMVTGVTDADEPHAIAVIGAKYDKSPWCSASRSIRR